LSEDTEKINQEYLKDLYADYKYSIEKFDSQALYISSGALGLSLAFVKDIVPVKDAVALWLFYVAMWLFVLVILIGFIAHYRSSKLIDNTMKLVDEGKLDQIKEDKSIDRTNKIIIGVLILGISALVLFVNLNLSVMSEQKENNSEQNPKPKVITEIPKRDQSNLIEKALKPKPLPSALNPNSPVASSGNDNQSSSQNSGRSTGSQNTGQNDTGKKD